VTGSNEIRRGLKDKNFNQMRRYLKSKILIFKKILLLLSPEFSSREFIRKNHFFASNAHVGSSVAAMKKVTCDEKKQR